MSNQEIFDKVATHLLKQGQRSVALSSEGAPQCQYRGDKGTMCAVGCLIPDERYDSSIEGLSVAMMTREDDFHQEDDGVLDALGFAVKFRQIRLLTDLQIMHDNVEPDQWKPWLIALGKRYGLNTDSIGSVDGAQVG